MTQEVYDFLDKPKVLKSQIVIVESQIEALKLSVLPGAVRYDRDKIQSSPEDPMVRYVIRLEELEKKKNSLMNQHLESVEAIAAIISKLPEGQSDVIAYKHLRNKSLKEISEAMGKSIGWIRFQLNKAYNTISTYC